MLLHLATYIYLVCVMCSTSKHPSISPSYVQLVNSNYYFSPGPYPPTLLATHITSTCKTQMFFISLSWCSGSVANHFATLPRKPRRRPVDSGFSSEVYVCVCVCARVHVCVRACVCVCVCFGGVGVGRGGRILCIWSLITYIPWIAYRDLPVCV